MDKAYFSSANKESYYKRKSDPVRYKNYLIQNSKNYTKRYSTDLNFKIRKRLRARLRKALIAHNSNKYLSTSDLLGITVDDFKLYLSQLFKPNMSWNNMGDWHIDHIIPCCAFDLSDPEQQKICFNYKNLQPLWKHENYSKKTNDLKLKLQLVKNKDAVSIENGKL